MTTIPCQEAALYSDPLFVTDVRASMYVAATRGVAATSRTYGCLHH
jgi:hypothetical protein